MKIGLWNVKFSVMSQDEVVLLNLVFLYKTLVYVCYFTRTLYLQINILSH